MNRYLDKPGISFSRSVKDSCYNAKNLLPSTVMRGLFVALYKSC